MSDPKHGGNVGPNDPAYYAPRELRERAASGEPDSVLKQAAEWRPRLTTEDPPPQAPGRLPQRRENSEMFTKAVAQALQEQMEPALVEAPSVLRDLSGRRALFSVALRISIAVVVAAGIASVLVMAIPASQRPANDTSSISAIWQQVKSSVLPAPQQPPTKAHRDLGRTGGQRARQRCAAARDSCGRSSSGRLRCHQWAAGRGAADVRQACRQRVARARIGNFRGFGYSVRWFRRSGAGDGGIARRRRRGTRRRLDAIVLDSASTRRRSAAGCKRRCRAAGRPAAGYRAAGRPCRCRAASRKPRPPPAAVARRLRRWLLPRRRRPTSCVTWTRGKSWFSSNAGRNCSPAATSSRQGCCCMRGAEARDARAALLLGTTYDPALLKQFGANGLADVAQARNWYQKARNGASPTLSGSLRRSRFPADFSGTYCTPSNPIDRSFPIMSIGRVTNAAFRCAAARYAAAGDARTPHRTGARSIPPP